MQIIIIDDGHYYVTKIGYMQTCLSTVSRSNLHDIKLSELGSLALS